MINCKQCRRGGIGIRDGLKIHCSQGLVGSTPTDGTIIKIPHLLRYF
jgi:hypothetical protein